jgi:hypothetical protein
MAIGGTEKLCGVTGRTGGGATGCCGGIICGGIACGCGG